MKYFLYATGALLFFTSCKTKEAVDLIVHHAVVHTVDSAFSIASAFAVKDGEFIKVGNDEEILGHYTAPNIVDNKGKPVYPGFIDAHGHFYNYGLGLQNANLTGTKSFSEVVQVLAEHREKYPEAPWIIGRGWDQNDWAKKAFPTKDTLDLLFPDTPVLLSRIDGHAALVNQKALDLAEVDEHTPVKGGLIQPTGLLIDNAIGLIRQHIPAPSTSQKISGLLQAQRECFKAGLTTVADPGLGKPVIDLIDSLHKAGILQMRIYAMLDPTESNMSYYFEHGPYKTDHLNVRSFKIYGDGALGSRGACLLDPYYDDPDNTGFLLSTIHTFQSLAKDIYTHGFQMNTHAIGDSANRVLLNIYKSVLQRKNNRRWRIEHAQIVSGEDLPAFGDFGIIPSVQPTHATSDMYWAEERLGRERMHTAYRLESLLEENGVIALGSDFPVESINPLYGFHAAITRRDGHGFPEGGFLPDEKLSRKEALKGMTIWAAYANFEEHEKGSIEAGKFADFVILEKDIMKVDPSEIRDTKVVATYLAGKRVYQTD